MLWIGEVEDAQNIDDLITSASATEDPIPDFGNLDFKIASGLRNILTGNFKNASHHSRRDSSQSEKRSLTGRQIAWMICDFDRKLWRK